MSTQAGGVIRDQNLNVHFNVDPLGVKKNVSTAQKKGGLGGRKALNDISNSGWSSTLQGSKKLNCKNVIPVREDMGPSKLTSSFGGKRNVSNKGLEKAQASSRKALTDVTNSGKPNVQKESGKALNKKLITVAEEQILPPTVAEEHFLHNHQECINAREKGFDMDYFLKVVGLDKDHSMKPASPELPPLSRKLKKRSQWHQEVEEIAELLYEDQSEWKMNGVPGECSCGSPKSPDPSELWNDTCSPDFRLMESPKLPKH